MNPTSHFDLDGVRPAVHIPTLICLFFLVQLWWKGELYGVQLKVFVLWFVATLAIQFTSQDTWGWIAGFLGQVALAIVLVLKQQWGDIL
jgi:hypothetical protein